MNRYDAARVRKLKMHDAKCAMQSMFAKHPPSEYEPLVQTQQREEISSTKEATLNRVSQHAICLTSRWKLNGHGRRAEATDSLHSPVSATTEQRQRAENCGCKGKKSRTGKTGTGAWTRTGKTSTDPHLPQAALAGRTCAGGAEGRCHRAQTW